MTYCFFSTQYLPTGGGVERYTHSVAKELIRRGHKAVVVTTLLPGLKRRETDENGIEIIRVHSFLPMAGRLPLLNPFVLGRLTKALNEFKIDRVVIQTRLYLLSLFGSGYAKRKGIPAVVIEHGTNYVTTPWALLNVGLKIYENVLVRWIHLLCPYFYTVSQRGIDWLKKFGIKADGVLYNCVESAAVDVANLNYRKKYGLSKTDFLIAYVGRLIPEKGVGKLVEAVKTLEVNAAGPVLIIAGDGLLEPQLKAMGGRIIALGKVSHAEVIALYRQADCFCLPSDAEGFPTTALEAAREGCLVISTDCGGIRELIADESYGIIIDDNRPETIAAAITNAAANRAECKTMAGNAKARVLERFTVKATCDRIEVLPWLAKKQKHNRKG